MAQDWYEELEAGAKSHPRYQAIKQYMERLPIEPGGLPAITRQQAAKEVIKQLFPTQAVKVGKRPAGFAGWPVESREAYEISKSPYRHLVGELTDLLRVISVTPKRAISYIKEFNLLPAKETSGTFHPESIRVFPYLREGTGSTMASSWSHEAAGHGAATRILGRLLKRQGYEPAATPGARVVSEITGMSKQPSQIQMGIDAYHSYYPELEGVAEYLGTKLQELAKVPPEVRFGHGREQQAVFEKLMEMPSKNPYMNVYRYLQKVVR